jgi:hypothetical protein
VEANNSFVKHHTFKTNPTKNFAGSVFNHKKKEIAVAISTDGIVYVLKIDNNTL